MSKRRGVDETSDLLNQTSLLNERIDLVLARGRFKIGRAVIVGNDPVALVISDLKDRQPSAHVAREEPQFERACGSPRAPYVPRPGLFSVSGGSGGS